MSVLRERIDSLLGRTWKCDCGRSHSVETTLVGAGRGALEDIPAVVRELGLQGRALVVSDANTRKVAGTRVAENLRRSGVAVTELVLEPHPGASRVHADDHRVAEVESAISSSGAGFCVAAGAGTINDLVKMSSFNKGVPYFVVATAASMNGYTSAIAAIDVKGIKRTLNCRQPLAVIADTDVLCAAPAALSASGVGDLMSKPVCNADWMLSHIIRGEYFCAVPAGISGEAADQVALCAAGIKGGDGESMLTLFYGLLLSGISMKIAGSSSPASGGEHLISHYWDMRAPISGREPGLHGAQVGVATLVTATLYSVLRDEWRTLSKGVSCAEPEHMEIETRAGFNEFYGALAPEVAAEYLKKFPSVDACRADADAIRRSASEIEAKVWPSLKPASKIRETLLAAGAPVTIDALGLGYEDAEEALLHGREIRGRYTVLDLAWELGVLPTRSAEMLEMVSGMLALKM